MHRVLFTFWEIKGRFLNWNTSVYCLSLKCRVFFFLMFCGAFKDATLCGIMISKHPSPSPGPRHFEPCLATAQGLPRRLATTEQNTTAPAVEQRSTDRLGLYPERARPAKTPTGILMENIFIITTTLTTPGIRATSTVAAGATHAMARDGARRL